MDQQQQQFVTNLLTKALEKIGPVLAKKAKDVVKDTWEKFKTDYMLVFSEYYKGAYDKYSKAKTVIYRYEPHPLLGSTGFYENPYIEKGWDKKYSIRRFRRFDSLASGDERIYVDSIEKLIALRTKCILLQGTGGIGKSTLMKFLFLDALRDKGYVPVFVELRELNDIEGEYDLSNIIFKKLYSLGSTLDSEYMERSLASDIYFFLLDGYDEISEDKRAVFIKKLETFIDEHPENYYILSSRPYSDFMELPRFTVFSLCPFTKEQAISQVNKLRYDSSVKDRFIEDLKKGLFEQHKDFASNPLLLNIMLLTYDQYAEIPDKLHIFYSEAFDTMFQKHDAINGTFRRPKRTALSYDEFKNSFSYFCFCTYISGKTEFDRDDIKNILNKQYSFNIDNYIHDLQNVLCVIIQDGTKFTFSHRSFQEYFAAYYLKELEDDRMKRLGKMILEKKPMTIYRDNVFAMLADMNRTKFIKNILLPNIPDIQIGKKEKSIDNMLHTLDNHFSFRALDSDEDLARLNLAKEDPFHLILTLHITILDEEKDQKGSILGAFIAFVHHHLCDKEIAIHTDAEYEFWQVVHDIVPQKADPSFTIPSKLLETNPQAKKLFLKTWIGKLIIETYEIAETVAKCEEINDAFFNELLTET